MDAYIHLGNKVNELYDGEIAKSVLRNGHALVLIDQYKNGVVKAIASNLKERFPESSKVDKEYSLTGLDVIGLTIDGFERKVVVNTLDSMISWGVIKSMGLSFGSIHIISEWIYECGVKGIMGHCVNFNELSEVHIYCRDNRPYESSIKVMKEYASLAEKTEFSYDFEIIDGLDALRYERGDYEICSKCEYSCSVSINDVIDYICDVKRRMTMKEMDKDDDGHLWIRISDTTEYSRCVRGQDGVMRTYVTKDCPYYAEQFLKGIQNEKKENEKC